MGDFRKKLLDNAKKRFAEHIQANPEYVVQQLHRDGDVVKLWRCGKPGSSTCAFWVCSSVHCLMVYGDMGECMWQRLPDMIPFIRSSIGSLSYFSEKVPQDVKIKTDYRELVDEWFDQVKEDRIEAGCEWGIEQDVALEELRENWNDFGDVNLFKSDLFNSAQLYGDCEDMPRTKFYSFQYLWIIEALKWFIQQLDGGKVLPYQEPQKEAVEVVQ